MQVGVVLIHLRPEIERRVDAVFRDLVDQCPDLRAVTLPLRVPPLLPLLVPLNIPAIKKYKRTDRRGVCVSEPSRTSSLPQYRTANTGHTVYIVEVGIKRRKDQVSLTTHPSIRASGAIACMNTP